MLPDILSPRLKPYLNHSGCLSAFQALSMYHIGVFLNKVPTFKAKALEEGLGL